MRLRLVVWNPVAIIAWLNDVKNEQNDIDHVPDAETAQSNQLADSNTRVANTTSIDRKYTQKYRVQ